MNFHKRMRYLYTIWSEGGEIDFVVVFKRGFFLREPHYGEEFFFHAGAERGE